MATSQMDDFETRFGGLGRLYGASGLQQLQSAHVAVVGIGGVGVWTVEALARSGIGSLTLIDLDDLCATNINRQLHALTETVGQSKVAAMAARIRSINPYCQVTTHQVFFSRENANELLQPNYDCVCDAIDNVADKAALLAGCAARKLPVISAGAAGGRRDATRVEIADLAKVTHDPLLSEVRKKLRQEWALAPHGSNFGIDCVFSSEPPVFPQLDGSVGPDRCAAEPGARLNCNTGFGSATFVTGVFGFVAAGWIVKKITGS